MGSDPSGARACDVLVIGSGAAGLSAAVTAAHHGLDVVVAEKASVFGGTSAWSGGWLWIPGNPLALAAGIVEPEDAPRAYLQSELGDGAHDPRIEVFLRNGPRMVSFFAERTAVAWIDGNAVPDFHATPGHAVGGRSVSVAPYDGRALGSMADKLRPPLDVISLGGLGIAGGADLRHFLDWARHPASARHVAWRLGRHAVDLLVHRRGRQLSGGNALVARLLRSALDLGVTLLCEAGAVSLRREDGRVVGATLRTRGGSLAVSARRGVILATGGFPHDPVRQARHFAHVAAGGEHHSAAPPDNAGDGLRLAEDAGAALNFDLAHPAAWAPVSLVPRSDGTVGRFPHLVDRAKPGIIAVGTDGRRFANEADSYHDFMKALFARTPEGAPPEAWLICDARARRRFGLGWAKPAPFPASMYVRRGYVRTGRTLAALAAACEIEPGRLEETVKAFNEGAIAGTDAAFGRGASPYNRAQGDPGHRPNPSLGPLERSPFYAVRLVPGSLGTFAGIATSPAGEALDPAGTPVPGLYAAGNDMTSIMGGHYPSGGITLGPGMTFGYVIGRHLAGRPVDGVSPRAAGAPSREEYIA